MPSVPASARLEGRGWRKGEAGDTLCRCPLPAARFLEKRDGQPALGLQGGLGKRSEQLAQGAHAAGAAGEDESADFVGKLQTAARGAQLQSAELVLVGEFLQLEHQR